LRLTSSSFSLPLFSLPLLVFSTFFQPPLCLFFLTGNHLFTFRSLTLEPRVPRCLPGFSSPPFFRGLRLSPGRLALRLCTWYNLPKFDHLSDPQESVLSCRSFFPPPPPKSFSSAHPLFFLWYWPLGVIICSVFRVPFFSLLLTLQKVFLHSTLPPPPPLKHGPQDCWYGILFL